MDLFATTLTIGTSAGPFTRHVLGTTWRVLLRWHRHKAGRRVLSSAGVIMLLGTVALWVLNTWIGWTMVFLAGDGTIRAADSGRPAGLIDTAYYVGFTLSTLGVGDFVAAGPGGRLLTVLASFAGLVVVTLSITYLLGVVSAVVARRSLAVHISALGRSADDVAAGGWSGDRFSAAFVSHLVSLTAEIAAAAEQHLAYPVLHYFTSRQPDSAAPVVLARLDDALLLLRYGVPEAVRPELSALEPLRRVLDHFMATAATTSAPEREPDSPPLPGLAALAAAGIPLVDAEVFARLASGESERRRRLRSFVVADGWDWPT